MAGIKRPAEREISQVKVPKIINRVTAALVMPPVQEGGDALLQVLPGKRTSPMYAPSYSRANSQLPVQQQNIQYHPRQDIPITAQASYPRSATPMETQEQYGQLGFLPDPEAAREPSGTEAHVDHRSYSSDAILRVAVSEQAPMRVLTGNVEKVLTTWSRVTRSDNVLFEVFGQIDRVRDGPGVKMFYMSDSGRGGVKMLVEFYEIDRTMIQLEPGQLVRVVGKVQINGRMQAFTVDQATGDELAAMQRVFHVSDRTVACMARR